MRLEKLTVIHLLLAPVLIIELRKFWQLQLGLPDVLKSTFQEDGKGMSEDVRLIHLKNKLSGSTSV